MQGSSELSGFYKLSMQERLELLRKLAGLTEEEAATLANTGGLPGEVANRMIENVVGGITLPLGMATNFLINGKDYVVPMALEEPSVVAAASNAAKIARLKGGFKVTNTGPVMIGQIQTVRVPNPKGAARKVLAKKKLLLERANAQDPMLVSLGGGAKYLWARVIKTLRGPMVIVELFVNCGDAMGANAVNTMAEAVAPMVEEITGGKVYLRIISNLADRRLVRATAIFEKEALGGPEVVEGIVYAYAFAEADPYRCATHNKGIMNGVIAVALACGQDTRALEAGAHSFASRSGAYKPLTVWKKTKDGDLMGILEMPMAVGLVGGAAKVHPAAKANVKVPRGKIRGRTGQHHGCGRARPELCGAPRALSRGDPEGAHEITCQKHRRVSRGDGEDGGPDSRPASGGEEDQDGQGQGDPGQPVQDVGRRFRLWRSSECSVWGPCHSSSCSCASRR